jgi:hypothetical protein
MARFYGNKLSEFSVPVFGLVQYQPKELTTSYKNKPIKPVVERISDQE